VSHENVEIVLRAYEHLNRGDVDALIDLCDDEFVMDMSERVFNPDIYRGRDDIWRFYGEVRNAWESYQWDVEETQANGDSVVAMLHCHGQSREGGPPVDWRVAWLWELRDRRLIALRFYRDRTAAVEALGSD
jgi:ketosteroid isomerase-like protein